MIANVTIFQQSSNKVDQINYRQSYGLNNEKHPFRLFSYIRPRHEKYATSVYFMPV